MPVFLQTERRACPEPCVTVGLINNMPDEALKATERQYTSLLGSASGGMQIRLSLYTLPGVPRGETSARHIADHYSGIEDLWAGQLDGLIVTGREPLAAKLSDEPYWKSFTKTLDWAQENAHSTVFSCLAAHAAVLHLDGINRVKRNDKFFGIFHCLRLLDHPLLTESPAGLKVAHSRWNSLREDLLVQSGYDVLTRTADGEVDTFVKQQKSLLVFFQGHPEYATDTLLREYRRDLGRYCAGETIVYPLMPEGYFDSATEAALHALQLRIIAGTDEDCLAEITKELSNAKIENTWQATTTRLYTNWLQYLRAQKTSQVRSRRTGDRSNAGRSLELQTAAQCLL